MATRLRLLLILLLPSLTAFSQTGISKQDSCIITLPCSTANKIAVDLVKGDSAIAELKLTQEQLALMQAKTNQQESIIKTYAYKEDLYREEVSILKQQRTEYESVVRGLEKDKKRSKIGIRVLGFAVCVTTLTTAIEYLIIQGK